MSENTKIEWCDHTFNPWEGCQKVGPGCDHCYAETRNARFAGGTAINWGPGAPRRRTSASNWQLPKRWNAQADAFMAQHGRRQRVFCASLADVFDNAVPREWRIDLFRLIRDTPNLDWLLLTKRIGNVVTMLADVRGLAEEYIDPFPWPNIWLGATIVNQAEADRDIPKLLAVPARGRFLSMEPLLGPVDLSSWIAPTVHCGACGAFYPTSEAVPDPGGHKMGADKCSRCGAENCMGTWWGEEAIEERSRPDGMELDEWDSGYRLHWVIVGGESGPGARPMHPDWARSLRDQCEAAGVPFLFKQWGEWTPGENVERHHGTVATAKWFNDEWSFHEEDLASTDGHFDDEPDLYRVGKKAAGRLLDGRTWDGFPA